MSYLKTFSQRHIGEKPVCRMLVMVQDNGHCQVEEFLQELRSAEDFSQEFRSLLVVLTKAFELGPRNINDPKLCKAVHGRDGGVFEFRSKRGLARIYWFYAHKSHQAGLETVVLVHGSIEKGKKQSDIIKAVDKTRRQYLRSPDDFMD